MTHQISPAAWDADDNKPVIPRIPRPRPASAELDTAIRVAQEMFATYSDSRRDGFDYAEAYGALRESLRLVLRALDAEPLSEEEAVRRSVDRAFPAVAAFLAAERGEDQ